MNKKDFEALARDPFTAADAPYILNHQAIARKALSPTDDEQAAAARQGFRILPPTLRGVDRDIAMRDFVLAVAEAVKAGAIDEGTAARWLDDLEPPMTPEDRKD
jgi:hypothetical protein